MSYYVDDGKITLDELKMRIKETDLVPSRVSLLDSLNENIIALQKAGISSLADLRKEIKTAKSISLLANKTKIDLQYLTLLRREIEAYFPKPLPVKSFDWLTKNARRKIEGKGLKNS